MRRTPRQVWAVLLGLKCCSALAELAPEALTGLSLEQALEVLRAEGLAIVYSSDLVKPWMRVATSPLSADPLRALSEILAPAGLAVRFGPAGSVLVVRGSAPQVRGADAPPGRAAEAPAEPPVESPLTMPIEEIVVVASQYQLAGAVGESVTRLWSDNIEYMPDLGDDALRSMARLPGIGTDSVSARSNVRGGETRETSVQFDGVRLHDPFHLKDFNSVFSAIDPRIVSSMDIYTGGFPAAFGESLSGVVDITSLSVPEPRHHEVSFSFFNTSVLSSGQFDGGEWVGSIRRGNLDLLHETSDNHRGRPTYQDAYAKVGYRFNGRLRLTGNFLHFGDDIFVTEPDGERQGKILGEDNYLWLRLDHSPGLGWKGTTIIARTRLSNERNGFTRLAGISSGSLSDRRTSTLHTLQSDWSSTLSERLLMRFGAMLAHMSGRYSYSDAVAFDVLVDFPGAPRMRERARDIRLNPSGRQHALYGSVRYAATERLAMELGLRWDRHTLSPAPPDTLAPRIGLRYRLAERLYLKGSLGRFYQAQAIHELQLEDGVARYFPPQRADHAVIGLERDFRSGLRLRLEAYHKAMSDLRPRYENLLNPLVVFPELRPDRIRIAPEQATARGLEVFVDQQLRAALTWWIGYSWSQVTDRIDGQTLPRSWDRPHALSAGLNWDTSRWNVGIAVAQHTGWPTTPVALHDNSSIVAPRGRNAERVGDYRSVDVRITRKFQLARSAGSVFLELTNLFDRSNPYSQEYQLARAGDALHLGTVNTLPRVPSLGFVWTF